MVFNHLFGAIKPTSINSLPLQIPTTATFIVALPVNEFKA